MNKSVITFLAAGLLSMAQKEAQAQTFIGRQTPKIENRTLTPELLWAMGRIGARVPLLQSQPTCLRHRDMW